MNEIKNLPPLYQEYGGGEAPEELVKAIKRGYSIYLYGAVGTGKTWTAIQLGQVAPARSYYRHQTPKCNVWFYIYEELMQSLLAEPETKMKTLNLALANDVIILDDLALFSMTPARQENLYLLINGVYVRKSQIIITSNFDPKALKEVDERVYDRLKQISIFQQLKERKRPYAQANRN